MSGSRLAPVARLASPPAVTGVLLLVLPLVFVSDYARSVLVQFCVMLILLTGLNFINGHARMTSMAHAGLFGLGAYTAGVLSAQAGLPAVAAFGCAPLLVTAVALVVGAAALRLRATYFTMATLAAGYVLYLLFGRLTSVTGGPNGLLGIPPLADALTGAVPMYALAAALAFLGTLVAHNVATSRTGRALRALGASESAAVASGVPAFRLRLFAFALSGCYAGVAGALQTFHDAFVSPSSFGFFIAVLFVVGLTVGGAGRPGGPLLGAALLTGLSQLGTEYAGYESLIVGVVFLLAVQMFPDGVGGVAARLLPRRAR